MIKNINWKLIAKFLLLYVVIIGITLIIDVHFKQSFWIKKINPYITPGVTIFVFLYTTAASNERHTEDLKEAKIVQEENMKNLIRPLVDLSITPNMTLTKTGDSFNLVDIWETDITFKTNSVEKNDMNILKIINFSKNNAAKNVQLHLFFNEQYSIDKIKEFNEYINIEELNSNEFKLLDYSIPNYLDDNAEYSKDIFTFFELKNYTDLLQILEKYILYLEKNKKLPKFIYNDNTSLLKIDAKLTYEDVYSMVRFIKEFNIVFSCTGINTNNVFKIYIKPKLIFLGETEEKINKNNT